MIDEFLIWSSKAGASAIGTLLNIIIVGGVLACLGWAMDKSNFIFTGLSADASNTIFSLRVAFWVSGFLFIIASIINHWITEKSMANQGA